MSTLTPRKKDWADDDSSDDGGEELRRTFGTPAKPKSAPVMSKGEEEESKDSGAQKDNSADPPVASLLSRIGGLSTDTNQDNAPPSNPSSKESPASQSPSSSSSGIRPKPNISNPLFGRALAGVKSDRSANPSQQPIKPSPNSTQTPSTSNKTENLSTKSQKDQDKMAQNLMDEQDEGWGVSSNSHGDQQPGAAETNAPNTRPLDSTSTTSNGDGGRGEPSGSAPVTNDPAQTNDDMSVSGSGLISNDFQVQVKLADLQADINSPLYSAKTFEQLPIHDDLKRGIYAASFKKPSKIQERALPLLLNNPPRNLIGQSQSGTGKTAAFTLDMLSRVDPAIMAPQAICLAPSRELARQIQEVVDKIGQFTSVQTFLAVPNSWKRGVKIDKHILIGTPGTVVDMLSRGGGIFDPRLIRVFVLDEADEMISGQNSGAGLGDQTMRIKRMLPRDTQIVLFSATFPDDVRQFAARVAPEANEIYLKQEEVTVDAIKQLWLQCDGEARKFDALSVLYELMTIGQSIVFCRRKDTADYIAQRLTSEGHSVASLHGGLESSARDDVLDTFRNGKTKVLITTNVVARGIDISQVNMVVNYDVPLMLAGNRDWVIDLESYIHRIGRTGRFGRKGCSIIFAHDEKSRQEVREIEARLGGKPMKQIDASSRTDIDQLEKALKAALKGPA